MKFLQLLSLFKSDKSDRTKYIPTLWENDYCQIELIPQENQSFIEQEVIDANLFAEQHKSDFGYSDIFMRKEPPTSTITKKIQANYLRSEIVSFQLPELLRMRYDGGKEMFTRGLKTQVFGFPSFTLFFDTKNEFVNNIWVKINFITSETEFDIILNSLYHLGEANDLILIDWNDDSIVNLKDKAQIKDYLTYWIT